MSCSFQKPLESQRRHFRLWLEAWSAASFYLKVSLQPGQMHRNISSSNILKRRGLTLMEGLYWRLQFGHLAFYFTQVSRHDSQFSLQHFEHCFGFVTISRQIEHTKSSIFISELMQLSFFNLRLGKLFTHLALSFSFSFY